MSERVITTTVEVTKVYRDVPECFENDKTKYGESMKNRVKDATDADNVVVVNVHEVELQGLRNQMDDESVKNSIDVEAEKIIENMNKDDRLISQMDVMKAVQKVLINLGYEPLGIEVIAAFDAIENVR